MTGIYYIYHLLYTYHILINDSMEYTRNTPLIFIYHIHHMFGCPVNRTFERANPSLLQKNIYVVIDESMQKKLYASANFHISPSHKSQSPPAV